MLFKKILTMALLCTATVSHAGETFFDLSATNNRGETVKFDTYRGKVILAVNTASKCGFTPQYKGLQQIQDKYKDKNVVVLGFPSDDFNQELDSDKEIASFCELNYGVKFPLFQKGHVKGDKAQPAFKYLTTTGEKKGDVSWNFEKFIVGKDGKVKARFSSMTKPTDSDLVKAIEDAVKS